MIFPIQAKLDSAVLSLTASTLVEPRPSLLRARKIIVRLFLNSVKRRNPRFVRIVFS